MASHFRRPTVL